MIVETDMAGNYVGSSWLGQLEIGPSLACFFLFAQRKLEWRTIV
jgi:hypothetical protein